jgi:hypothetical protein
MVGASGALNTTAAAHDDNGPKVVADGLDNPRQLTFDKRGALYVVEAGRGGTGTCIPGPEGPEICFGLTGAVTKVKHGQQWRVVKHLPSLADSSGEGALGPSDIVVDKEGKKFVLAVGLGGDPAVRDLLPEEGEDLASLLKGKLKRHHSHVRQLADLGEFEAEEDPDGAGPDSNPVAVIRDGDDYVVVDAGANALLEVDDDGDVDEVLAVFPKQDAGGTLVDAVPTSVAKGKHGAWFVSQLTGFPFVPGAAKIWRVEEGEEPEVYAEGLTNVTDLAFDGRDLYAVQIADAGLLAGPIGSLVKVDPKHGDHETVAGGLFAPYGVAIRKDHAYVTTGSVLPGGGEVVKIDLDD